MSRPATVAALAAAILAGLALYRTEQRAKALKIELFQIKERLYDQLTELRRWDSVRPISGLKAETLQIGHVKILDVEIRPFDARDAMALAIEDTNWQPKNQNDLAYPFPEVGGSPSFSPYFYAANASAIMRRRRATNDNRFIGPIPWIEHARDRVTEREGRSAFIVSDRPYELGSVMLPAGWRSAFANAAVMVGLLDLREATADDAFLDLARQYLAGLVDTETSSKLWRIDESQYLWFEEYPAIAGRPTSVMNGHINVVLALHRYWTVTGDATVLPLIKAGLATAARYMWEVRKPGSTSAYWLHDLKTLDYGPLRATRFPDALLAISGHPIFRELSDALKTDMPIR